MNINEMEMMRRQLRQEVLEMHGFHRSMQVFKKRVNVLSIMNIPIRLIDGEMRAIEAKAIHMVDVIWTRNGSFWLQHADCQGIEAEMVRRAIDGVMDLRDIIGNEFPDYDSQLVEFELE